MMLLDISVLLSNISVLDIVSVRPKIFDRRRWGATAWLGLGIGTGIGIYRARARDRDRDRDRDIGLGLGLGLGLGSKG